MPREGLTSELRSDPSEFKMADLNESIKAVTWGSLQMLDGFPPGETVAPGTGVVPPAEVTAGEGGAWVEMTNVEVGKAKGVGVGGAGVVGKVHPTSRTNPMQS